MASRLTSIVAFFLSMFMSMTAAAAELRIGVVDGTDVIAKSAAGRQAQERIRKKADELGLPLIQQRQDLAKQLEEFQKQAAKMKEESRRSKSEEIEKKLREFESQKAAAERQLREFQETEMAPLLKKLETAVSQVAKENKLSFVFDTRSSGLLFFDQKQNITEKVRELYNK